MKLEQWIETTEDWKSNLVILKNKNDAEIKAWKKDFRPKIIIRLAAVLCKVYPETNHWTIRVPRNAESWEYLERWTHHRRSSIYGFHPGEEIKELFWGDLEDCEIHFLDLIFKMLPERKELELAIAGKWEKFAVDERNQLIDAIMDLKKIEKWGLNDDNTRVIKMRILCPQLFRIRSLVFALYDLHWDALFDTDIKNDDLRETELKLKSVAKTLSFYEPADRNKFKYESEDWVHDALERYLLDLRAEEDDSFDGSADIPIFHTFS